MREVMGMDYLIFFTGFDDKMSCFMKKNLEFKIKNVNKFQFECFLTKHY